MDVLETLAVAIVAGGMIVSCGEVERGEAAATEAEAEAETSFEAGLEDWKARRLARLTEPYGYLSLTALTLLDPGSYRVGAADDADIDTGGGPEFWGTLIVPEGPDEAVRFVVAGDAEVRVGGDRVAEAVLRADGPGGPTLVESGDIRFHLVDPGGRVGVRVRDPRAPTRVDFAGLDYYSPDPAWVVEGRFEAAPEGATLPVANVLGQIIDEPLPGRVVFRRDGQQFSLDAVEASDGRLFFIFADRTSGRETYGLGRFLYADPPENGRVVLDFNRAYNPPCAFTDYSTCPLPPPQNRLPVPVTAGEKDDRVAG